MPGPLERDAAERVVYADVTVTVHVSDVSSPGPLETASGALGPYLLPRNAQESLRQRQQHAIFFDALHAHVVASPALPLGPGARMLDAGCGDGYWLFDVTGAHPEAGAGLDVQEPTSLTTGTFPFTFVRGSVLERLPLADAAFDIVHQRMLCAAIPQDRWPSVVRELVRLTRPRGWIELVEGGPIERIPAPCTAVRQLAEWTIALARERGIDLEATHRLGEILRAAAGLNQQTIIAYERPLALGYAAGSLGARAADNWLAARASLKSRIIEHGWSDAESYDATLAQAETELRQHMAGWPVHVAYAARL
jgi:SAM-dependent methyltransferase